MDNGGSSRSIEEISLSAMNGILFHVLICKSRVLKRLVLPWMSFVKRLGLCVEINSDFREI
jgi:hypothetical protein